MIVLSLALSSAVVFMDSAILPVALPTIQKQLNITNFGLDWIINAYALILASLFLLGGKIGDLFGHRRIYLCGMAFFSLGSIFCGVSSTALALLGARIFQGCGGALMIPSSMALVMENFHPRERGRCIGLLVAIGSVFLSLAPCIGGALTELISWRGIFFVNLPILAFATALACLYIPPSEKIQEPFDFLGFLYFAGSFVSIVLALMLFRDQLLFQSKILAVIGCLLFSVLVKHLKSTEHPFIDYRLFYNATFRIGNVLIFCAQFVIMISAYWTIYFQKGLGFTPIKAGLFSLISSCPLIVCAPLSGYLCDRLGPRLPCVIGFICTCCSFCFFCITGCNMTLLGLVLGLIGFGVGVSLVMTPIGAITVGSIGLIKKGQAAGIYGTIRNSATPIAVAVFGSLISNVSYLKFSKKIYEDTSISVEEAGVYLKLFSENALRKLSLEGISLEKTELLEKLGFQSIGEAFFYCNLLCTVVCFSCVFISYFYLPHEIKSKLNGLFN